jgi:polar amino acid transport system substrate-binding protein
VQYDLVLAHADGKRYTSLADFVEHGTGRLNVTRGMTYDAAIETQLAALASSGRLEVVNDFETVFGKLAMGRADGTLATPPIYTHYLQLNRLKAGASVIPLPESSARFTGMYLSKKTMDLASRRMYAETLKAMVAEQAVPALYRKYFDDATIQRTFRQGQAPLLKSLSAPTD